LIYLKRPLGFQTGLDAVSSALDIFAMTEALSSEGEALWDEAMAQVERERRNPTLSRAREA